MSSPFANGSAFAQPMTVQPATPPPAQLEAQYQRQVYANQTRAELDLQNAIERDRLIQRGRALAGFVQIDRRNEGMGFVWQRQQRAAWPVQLPEPARVSVERAIDTDHHARHTLEAAGMQFNVWAHQHPTASEALLNLKREELTIDHVAAAQKAAQALDAVLADVARLAEAIEQWQALEQSAPSRREAAERRYQKELSAIDAELQTARMTVGRAGVTV